ncbi:MAG: bifunctional riboflavin kinase/FAD synthetase [Gammaproteobacteria bacterium]|nr:bifunctional riboflavin kinase/FAD synthetase [Gammaproteobacteria bacterium]
MQFLRSLRTPNIFPGGSVVTVGNFDGVHLGHQAVIGQLKQHARQLGLQSVVLTFEPQPLEHFQPEAAPARLSSFRDKFLQLRAQGVDKLVCLRFQDSLAKVSAEEFVQRLFVEALGMKRIIIGDDFRFGRDRKGDIHTLRSMGETAGFDVVPIDSFSIDGERVSSSRIRKALDEHDFDTARSLLGRAYCISGRVRHGEKRGRQLGFPTANVSLSRNTSALLGVYAVQVTGLDGVILNGVANLGTRPVFDGKQLLLEVHLLDYSKDIYGRHINVEFLKHLRGEQKFASIDELQAQINQDVDDARAIFELNNNN